MRKIRVLDNVYDLITINMEDRFKDNVAFRFYDTANDAVTTILYKDYVQDIRKAVNYFQSTIPEIKGKKICLLTKNSYEYAVNTFGVVAAGAVLVLLNQRKSWDELSYELGLVEPDAILTDGDDYGTKEQLQAAYGSILRPMDGFRAYEPVAEMPRCIGHDDLMILMFTSGTTGYPKIAEHNYKYALGHYITAKYWHNVNPEGLHFTISDTGWGKALWGKLYGQWMCEAPIFTYDFDKFDAHDILPMFKQYNITTFCAPPTMYRFFIKEDLSKYDLSSIEYSTTAGEALNPEVYEQWKRATGLSIYEGFGQTETTLSIYNPVGSVPKSGSMGIPSPLYDVDLILPDGTPAPVGETGEIVIRTDKHTPCGLFMGYYRDEEKTREAWSGGVYHTGDTAWRDEDGYFFYVGRTDDVIKSSGYRIGPFEIESVIMELPYVLECAVTSAPDPIRGQVVKASIVLTKGTQGTEALKKEIQTYVKTNTAPYKYPRIVEFRDELPKTISGKIRRVELKG